MFHFNALVWEKRSILSRDPIALRRTLSTAEYKKEVDTSATGINPYLPLQSLLPT